MRNTIPAGDHSHCFADHTNDVGDTQCASGLRTRVVSWADPIVTLHEALAMGRAEMLRAMEIGALPRPPIGELLGIDDLKAYDGHAVMGMDLGEYLCNPLGIVAGGVAATVMDSAMWCAVATSVSGTTILATTSLTVHFVRPLPVAAGRVHAEANAIHTGRSTATADCRLVDSNAKLYAHATATFHCTELGKGGPDS